MMRSLFSGVAGLRTHQTRMDVIGNNIANVNTTAYKSQSMTFSDLMYQTTQAASGANATTGVGGINARQIGLGAKTAAIKTAISGQGSAQTTNDPFDIMISGDAFFIVSNGSERFFTRDGSFYIDGKGNLAMTSTGYNVMGWQQVDNDGNIVKDTVTPLRIMTEDNMIYPPEATTEATVSGCVDKHDPNVNSSKGSVMDLEIYDNQGYKYTVRMSVHSINGDAGQFYVQLDDIKDSEGISIMDREVTGAADGATVKDLVKLNPDAAGAAGTVTVPGTAGGNDTTVSNAATLNFVNGKGTFENVGGVAGTAGQSTINLSFGGIANFPANVVLDFSATYNYDHNGTSTIGAIAGVEGGRGSGRSRGEMSSITVSKDGMIYASYTNGQRKLLGQISTASFANPSGLAKEGDNLYSATTNSGDFDGIGEDITVGGGRMESGVLEMSNVDLSAEFTEMITTQRGFQANSRIITVSDTLLEELTNLKR
ncbi:MAG: flagellar hook-basal body complex protein [Lachnospiraceae bacterium]|nr:flagellar hook-basal body complex protein [Lachnospiraceae bacterium]